MKCLLATLGVIVLFTLSVTAQVTPPAPNPPGSDTMKIVQIISAERYAFKKKDSLTELLLMVGNVALKQDNTLFYGDSVVYNRRDKIVEAFKNVHINDNDSIDTYSDYLLYHTDTKIALLKDKVLLTDGKSNLHTNELEYFVRDKIGIYRKGGKVINGTSTLTSNEATYYADIKDVYFKQNVKLVDPQYTLDSDSLLYNTETEIATFIAKTYIEDSAKRNIVTREGYYDLKNKNASFGARPIIKDGATTTIANNIDTDDITGISVLTGNAVFKDTAQGLSVLANSIIVNKTTGSMLATQKPLMIIKQDNDSTFISADTLYSGRLSELEVDTVATVDTTVTVTSNQPDSLTRGITDSTKRALAIADSLDQQVYPSDADSVATARREAAGVIRDALSAKDSLSQKEPPSITDSIALTPQEAKDSIVNALKTDSPGKPDKKTSKRKRNRRATIPAPIADTKEKDTTAIDSLAQNVTQQRIDTITTIPANIEDSIQQALVQKDSLHQEIAIQPADSLAKDSLGNLLVRKDTLTTPAQQNDSADRFFRAYHNVRIFSDSLQAVCDSLFYSGKDSIFRLFRDPIVWSGSGESQITGDTIYLYTKNKKPDEMYVFENGFMINKTGDDMYNQIKGTKIFGYFVEGEIDNVRAKGNAESIYYAKDSEDKLVGINKATSAIIDMRFKNKELNKVVFIDDVKGTMLPIRQATEQDKRLKSFKWQEERRPKSKFELFGD